MLALTKDGTDVVQFKLKDGPCPISEDYFVLLNRPGTPILRYDSIMRGMDIPGVYEGDIISFKHKDYMIKYQKGYNAVSLSGEVLDISKLKYLKVKTHMYFQNSFKPIVPTLIRMRIRGKIYPIKKIFGATKKGIVVNERGLGVVEINEIQQDAGMRVDGKKVYFGKNDDKFVCLKRGRVIVDKY